MEMKRGPRHMPLSSSNTPISWSRWEEGCGYIVHIYIYIHIHIFMYIHIFISVHFIYNNIYHI